MASPWGGRSCRRSQRASLPTRADTLATLSEAARQRPAMGYRVSLSLRPRLLVTLSGVDASDAAPGREEPLPWSMAGQPPELTALETAMEEVQQAMNPSTPTVESVRLLESASFGLHDAAERIEEYLPEAETTLTTALRAHGHAPATTAAGGAADQMLAELRHLARASRAYAETLHDPDVDERAAQRELQTVYDATINNLTGLIDGAS